MRFSHYRNQWFVIHRVQLRLLHACQQVEAATPQADKGNIKQVQDISKGCGIIGSMDKLLPSSATPRTISISAVSFSLSLSFKAGLWTLLKDHLGIDKHS